MRKAIRGFRRKFVGDFIYICIYIHIQRFYKVRNGEMNLWIDAKLVSVLRAIKSFFFPMLCGMWDLSFPTRD